MHAADIARLLDKAKALAPTAANDLLRLVSRIFAFGVRRRVVTRNPAADFRPRLDAGGTEKPRDRALSADELTKLFEALRKAHTFGGDNFLAMRLLLALCVRKAELLAARWAEFDLEGHISLGPVCKRREALAQWTRLLQDAERGDRKVTPMRRKATK